MTRKNRSSTASARLLRNICAVSACLAPVSSSRASRDRYGFLPGRVELRAHVLSMPVIVHIDELVRDRFGDGLVAVQCAHLAENESHVHVDANHSSDLL